MKVLLVMILSLVSNFVNAQISDIGISCTNNGNTIQVNSPEVVRILTGKYSKDGKAEDKFVEIPRNELTFKVEGYLSILNENQGCIIHEVFARQMTLAKKDGTKMPDAYNRQSVSDGSLSDGFICAKDITLTPPKGATTCQ